MAKKSILDFQEMKKKSEKIVGIVVYDFWNAKFAEVAEADWLLVGDSVGMSVYGYDGTIPVTMEQMIYHSEAVRRGAPNTFVIGDMPFGSYQRSAGWAVMNAERFYKEARMDAIKLEGGVRVVSQIKAITEAGMNVMGHIGLTPQSSGQMGGFKAQGRTTESAMLVIKDALAVAEAGAFAILVEAVPPEVTEIIAERLEIPVLSIGAGPLCDGQLLLKPDLLGEIKIFTPKFVESYFGQAAKKLAIQDKVFFGDIGLASVAVEAFKQYVYSVKMKIFPDIQKHCYKMLDGELEKLKRKLGMNIIAFRWFVKPS